MNYFLDTNTCIYYLKGSSPKIAGRLRRTSPNRIKIPAVVKAELLLGAQKSERRERVLESLGEFLMPFEVMPFGDESTSHYAEIREDLEHRGLPIGPNDLLIAATAVANGLTLVTANTDEFARVIGLSIENWETLS